MRLCLILSAVAALAFFVIGCEGGETKLKCTSHDDCFDGYRCDLVDSKTCLSACKTHRECLAGQVCDIPPVKTRGYAAVAVRAAAIPIRTAGAAILRPAIQQVVIPQAVIFPDPTDNDTVDVLGRNGARCG